MYRRMRVPTIFFPLRKVQNVLILFQVKEKQTREIHFLHHHVISAPEAVRFNKAGRPSDFYRIITRSNGRTSFVDLKMVMMSTFFFF